MGQAPLPDATDRAGLLSGEGWGIHSGTALASIGDRRSRPGLCRDGASSSEICGRVAGVAAGYLGERFICHMELQASLGLLPWVVIGWRLVSPRKHRCNGQADRGDAGYGAPAMDAQVFSRDVSGIPPVLSEPLLQRTKVLFDTRERVPSAFSESCELLTG